MMTNGGAGGAEKVHPGTADEQGRQHGAQSWLQVLLTPSYENLLSIEFCAGSLLSVVVPGSRLSS